MARFAVWILVALTALAPLRAGPTTIIGGGLDPTTEADVQCFVITSARIAAATDPAVRTKLIGAFYYYLGRMDGRHPGFDVQNAAVEELRKLRGIDANSQAQRCGTEFQARANSLADLGEKLQAAEAGSRNDKEGEGK
jgi:hypothetical protein